MKTPSPYRAKHDLGKRTKRPYQSRYFNIYGCHTKYVVTGSLHNLGPRRLLKKHRYYLQTILNKN